MNPYRNAPPIPPKGHCPECGDRRVSMRMRLAIIALSAVSFGVLANAPTACTPAEQQQISKIAPEGAACVFAIVEDVSVAPDIAGTIAKCGVTAADIYALVSSLLAQKSDAGGDAAVGVSASGPHLIAWAQAAVEYDRAHK